MIYERPLQRLRYTGSVKAQDAAGRILRCQNLEALMGQNDRFENLTCAIGAVLENPARGQVVRGDEVFYETGAGKARITGRPAEITGQDGTKLRGPVVLYDLEAGTAQVQSLSSTVEPPPAPDSGPPPAADPAPPPGGGAKP
jgi:hypothetical protein